jgi:hypothetical protein
MHNHEYLFFEKCLDPEGRGAHNEHIERGHPAPTKGSKMTKTLTPAELAEAIGTDARTVRKFLRSGEGLDMKVGKGHRWAIEAKQVRSLKSRFAKWEAARTAPAADEVGEDENADSVDENEVLEVEIDDAEVTD